jgi:predicted DsbA family dithiol-disulfide isomerase
MSNQTISHEQMNQWIDETDGHLLLESLASALAGDMQHGGTSEGINMQIFDNSTGGDEMDAQGLISWLEDNGRQMLDLAERLKKITK